MSSQAKKLQAFEGYRNLLEKAYRSEGISGETIVKALASYQRTILSTESAFDRWRKGDARAANAAARRGVAVFEGKGNCAKCHSGFNFTDNGFHNIGLKTVYNDDDPGRYAHREGRL